MIVNVPDPRCLAPTEPPSSGSLPPQDHECRVLSPARSPGLVRRRSTLIRVVRNIAGSEIVELMSAALLKSKSGPHAPECRFFGYAQEPRNTWAAALFGLLFSAW